MPLKIAVWHNLPSGGGKRALYYHVRGLLERGHHLESWCPSTADPNFLPLNKLITEHTVGFSWPPKNPIKRTGKILSSWWEMYYKLKAMDEHCRRCAEEINRGEFDLLFANSCMFFRTTSIGRYVQLPKVLYLQEPYRPLYEAFPIGRFGSVPELPWVALTPPENGRWSFKYFKDFILNQIHVQAMRMQVREELHNARHFHKILVNSFFSRESILRAYGLDASVCYLGIDTKQFFNRHGLRKNFVVGLGAIVPEKNLILVIDSLARIKKDRPLLVWIGNVANPYHLKDVEQHAHKLGVSLEVKIGISDEEIQRTLDSALAMIYSPRLEPFGFAPLEANACGVPVIGVAEGGIRETIIDGLNGLLVEPNPEEISQALIHLMSDRAYAHQLGENGAKLVADRWPLDTAIDRLETRFSEVLKAS